MEIFLKQRVSAISNESLSFEMILLCRSLKTTRLTHLDLSSSRNYFKKYQFNLFKFRSSIFIVSLINELRRVIFQTILKSKNNPLRTMHSTLMQTLTELDQARRTRCLSNFIVHWKAGKRKRVAYRWAPSLRIRFYSRQGGLRFIPHYVRFVCGTGTRAIFSYSFRLDPRRRWLRATIHRPRIAAAVIYRFATRLEPRDNKGSR